jgi:plastocyanin
MITCVLWVLATPSWAADTGTVVGTVTLDKKGTAGPIVVYVDGPGPEVAPLAEPAKVIQKNMQFVPHGLVVPPGTVVSFPNDDNRFHNAFSTTPGASFDLGVYNYGESRSYTFPEAGVVDVYCNKHQSMAMQILVVPNAWFVEVDDKGGFRLEGLTLGKHRVTAWTPDHLLASFEVHVEARETASVDFRLARDPSVQNHLNKHGMRYEYAGDH